jgi:hypothetical protein
MVNGTARVKRLHNFENFSEKVDQFNAVSGGFPTIETIIRTSE